MMTTDEKNEAMENIRLIKDLMLKTKREMVDFNSGWIAIVWGVFCIIGFLGQQFLIPQNAWSSAWWTGLSLVAVYLTIRISRSQMRGRSQKWIRFVIGKFIAFWIPLLLLAYTLLAFCVIHPDVSTDYISVGFMLVISVGYLMIGFLIERLMIWMGIFGYVGSLVTALFFLKYSNLVFCFLFGFGLILIGYLQNAKTKKKELQ